MIPYTLENSRILSLNDNIIEIILLNLNVS